MALSQRGQAFGQIAFDHGASNGYHPVHNPKGSCELLYAENRLMHDELTQFINAQNICKGPIGTSVCAYAEGDTGTYRLRSLTAQHLNEYFAPHVPIDTEHITYVGGATALNEACALVTCDPPSMRDDGPQSKDGILLGKYNYGAFPTDLVARASVEVIHAPFGDVDQFMDVENCIKPYVVALKKATENGTKVKALVICNPNHPLGRCYSSAALKSIMRFCETHELHLISDEIYGLCVYQCPGRKNESFTSVLAIDSSDLISLDRVHVIYGISKNYAAGGLRLGCLITRNDAFTKAVRGGVCRFSCPSNSSMDIVVRMLEDRNFIRGFLQRSISAIAKQRLLAEKLLDEAQIDYYKAGNAGLFMWLDLSPALRPQETNGDKWAAETLLASRLAKGGVMLSTGKRYQSEQPGRFRMIFSYDEPTLSEGIRRQDQNSVQTGDKPFGLLIVKQAIITMPARLTIYLLDGS